MKSRRTVIIIMGLFIFLSLNSYARAQEPKRMFILAEVGGLFAPNAVGGHFDPVKIKANGKYVLGRIGLVYGLIPEAFDWFVTGGGAILAGGGEPSKSFFTVTTGFTAHFSLWWLGVGVTYATEETTEDWDLTNYHLTFNTGIEVFKSQSNIGSIFLEWQHPMRYRIGQGRGGSLYYKAIVGFRYLF